MTISVIIPVWNRAKLLERAIMSVVAQTHSVNEIIIVDDGSSDDTTQIIETIQNKTHVINSVAKTKNIDIQGYMLPHCGMVSKVRNYGIKKATGKWIAFLDSDDEWMPNKIALQHAQLNAYKTNKQHTIKYNWCHTQELWLRTGKEISQKSQKHARQGDIFKDALVKCIVGPSTVLIRKNLFDKIGLFREDLEIAEDYEMWLRICNKEKIAYVNEPLVIKHAGHGNQLSEKYPYIEKFRINALKKLLDQQTFEKHNIEFAKQELLRKEKIWECGFIKRKEMV